MQSKLKLDLEDLAVESFDISVPAKPKGTVFGEQCTCHTACTCPGCPTCNTCGNTCEDTCWQTCVYTCDDDTCAAWCGNTGDTYCNCGATCGQTDCGPYFCCA